MEIQIRAIGRPKPRDPMAILVDDYLDRANKSGRVIGFRRVDLTCFDTPKQASGSQVADRESAWLLSGITGADFAIALDERGDDIDSMTFAKMLEKQRDKASGPTTFLIGGAAGHTEAIRERANLTLRFGQATWPHMIARIMLCEQLYRAMTILSGHPYHRA